MLRSLRWGVLATVLISAAGCEIRVDVGDGGTGGGIGAGGGGSTSGGGTGNTGGGGGGNGGFGICSASTPCPSGQFCFNGLCALGCQNNGNCAADQYCATDSDRLCHNKQVSTCSSNSSCASSQICFEGFCSTPPPATQCDPDQVSTGNDGCNASSLCSDDPDTSAKDPKCYSFPACAQDRTCPTGLHGALCNDGLIPNKGFICLIGYCKTVSNCPSNWSCVKGTANDVVGLCSSGGVGQPCTESSQCASHNCQTFPGFIGLCL